MTLFTKSDGTTAQKSDSYEASNNFELIPEGEKLLVNVMSCQRKENSTRRPNFAEEGTNYLEVLLIVVEGKYRNKTCGHKLFIEANEGPIKDKAIHQLIVYETISKGKLSAIAKDVNDISKVSDRQYSQAFNGLSLSATFGVWEMKGDDDKIRSGNFVRGISSASKAIKEEDSAIEKKVYYIDNYEADDDFNIPF